MKSGNGDTIENSDDIIIYADVCAPFENVSHGEEKYFLGMRTFPHRYVEEVAFKNYSGIE